MSMFNLSDRLKAAVNQIEATGTSLQQRAIGQNQHPQPSAQASSSQASSSRAQSPVIAKATSPIGATSTHTPDKDKKAGETAGTSPTKVTSPGYSTSALAEGALSGLRKSFNFGRQSLEGTRLNGPSSPKASSSASTTAIPVSSAQELKDIPTSPASGSRPSSPGRFLNSIPTFQLGSDPSSSIGTPIRARSPQPGASGLRSPLTVTLPPDPDDPASYPLPPSPVLPSSPLPNSLSTPSALFADPLGASPLLPPTTEEGNVPVLGIEEATPIDEKPEEEVLDQEANGHDVKPGTETVKEAESDTRLSAESKRSVDGNEDTAAALQKAEKRYEELSNRFTKLLTQKHNADKVLKELTPLEGGIADSEALEGWVRMMNGKVEMITDEMKRLQGKIAQSRIEELRDTHRLEGSSQSELITKLRTQLSTAESNVAKQTAELASVAKIKEDLSKAQTTAKEEEEKRTKAISLLKTVRMKLVKVEKEREEIEKDRAEERAERSSAKDELERVKAEKEREVNQLRKGFERELASAKERYEKELQTKKAAWELEMITTKASHAKELSGKSTKVSGLEAIVKELNLSNNSQFRELQACQAEVESGREELESLRNRTKELEFQLREAHEKAAVLEESPMRPGRSLHVNARTASPSPARGTSSPLDVQRLLADAEAKSEAKISDLRNKIHSLEKERNESEEEWAVKLSERTREVEKLRRVIAEKESEHADSLRSRREREKVIEDAEVARKKLEVEMRALKADIEQAKAEVAAAAESERAAKEELSGLQVQISTLSGQLDDAKNHSNNLRNNNKTLREELRKVQSSVQLLEKSRNPGVGYWSSANTNNVTMGMNSNASRSSIVSPGASTPTKERKSMESSRTAQTSATQLSSTNTPTGSAERDNKEEEEVNLEYLRNVILQFLEHKEMRPNLVRVLSVILRFTPQELRRLNAKVLS